MEKKRAEPSRRIKKKEKPTPKLLTYYNKAGLISKVLSLKLMQSAKPFYHRPPKKINSIVIDIDYTLFRALSPHAALEKNT